MTIRMLRKPPIGNLKSDRLKITLAGNHTLKQKTCMLLLARYYLQHEQNIGFAGPTDVYLALVDEFGHPLTHFRNGNTISDWNMIVDHPYHCAADEHGL